VTKDTFYLNITTADDIGIGLFKYYTSNPERFIITNTTLASMLGYESKEQFQKLKFNELFLDEADCAVFFKTLRRANRIKFFEVLLRKKSGKSLWVAISASHVRAKGRDTYLEGIIEDISAHRKMEDNLAMERDLMQGLLDNIPDAVYFKDRENRIVKVNKFYAEGFKLTPEDITGKTDFDFFPQDQARRMFEDDTRVISTGQPIVGKIERTLLPNGTWNQVITTKIPIFDRQGNIIGTMGITRDMTAYANMERQRRDMLINTLNVLCRALGMRDPYTFNHTRRVADIAEHITKSMGWDEDRVLGMRLAAELHDLGKIGVPLDILNKPGRLSDLEYSLIQQHVGKCYDLIKDIDFPFPLAQTVYQHHERMDGTGYPQHLKGDDILLESRILAVSDVLEAMTYHRPYREALGIVKALDELRDNSGSKYDSQVVDVALRLIKENNNLPFWTKNS